MEGLVEGLVEGMVEGLRGGGKAALAWRAPGPGGFESVCRYSDPYMRFQYGWFVAGSSGRSSCQPCPCEMVVWLLGWRCVRPQCVTMMAR